MAATTDWLPTLSEAAGISSASDYPPDGISLLPMLAGGTPPRPRAVFRRYKTNAPRAMRLGDFKNGS